MTNSEAIGVFKERIALAEKYGYTDEIRDYIEAMNLAIDALEKQEQTIDKSCETCKHKDRLVSEWRCSECFRASNLEDYWEPYTEGE